MNRTIIIAEAGVNHNGNLSIAKKMVVAAKTCGADIIKFQTAKVESLVSKFAEKADYQKESTGYAEGQLEMLRRIMLTFEETRFLHDYCKEKEMIFLSTPFDIESINFLDNFKMPFWKIPSGEVNNVPYLMRLAATRKPIVMSTGMCELEEIDFAMKILKKNGTVDIKLLHCNTSYPTHNEDVNLNAMLELRKKFGVEVGFSDHTIGINASIVAAALGAPIIEKHFTLDKNMEGPDQKCSLEPSELKEMVSSIRDVEKMLGSGLKIVTCSEGKNKVAARKSIVAKSKIMKGETFTAENITTKRPGDGISPAKWYSILGLVAKRDFEEDEKIEL